LLPVLHGGHGGQPVLVERFAMREATPIPGAAPLAKRDIRYRVYRRGDMKLAVTSSGETLVFDLARDPGETGNAPAIDDGGEPAAGASGPLVSELDTWVAALGLTPLDQGIESRPVPLDPAAEQRLRALGYVQ
jgi:hypothetical protein